MFYHQLWMQGHFIRLVRAAHPLATITCLDKFLSIFKNSGLVVAHLQNIMSSYMVCKVSTARSIMAGFSDIINFVLLDAPENVHIRSRVEKVSSNPGETSAMLNNQFPFSGCQMFWQFSHC